MEEHPGAGSAARRSHTAAAAADGYPVTHLSAIVAAAPLRPAPAPGAHR